MIQFAVDRPTDDLVAVSEAAILLGRPDAYFALRRKVLAGYLPGGYRRGRLYLTRAAFKKLLAAQRAFAEATSPDRPGA